jgi:hypothetical protein
MLDIQSIKTIYNCTLLGYYAMSSGKKLPLLTTQQIVVRNYHYLLRNNPEDHSSHQLHGGG